MADTVLVETVYDGRRRKLIHLTNISDGTGESAVTKVDISTFSLYDAHGNSITPTYSTIDTIDYFIQGFASVRLNWAHTTPDEIAVLPPGSGTEYYHAWGGKTDPRSAGSTGDITLTTNGGSSGATYDIIIALRLKAA